ncbi:peptidylprolyl isomerase [Tunicatimonas pelagia]|uniref:peptidylprolyl isomerase n=1 Tax=Tunicatimonas pelagia TaxID=931531 RepID=UPI0026655240|nr:peptidylprolyl isomerase [Tunicatimonas pelagia]WKN40598.1 peptidylprolyl isomerase [Tunicatimonas pelagia]
MTGNQRVPGITRIACLLLLLGIGGCAATKKSARSKDADYSLSEAVLFTSAADTVFADEFLYVYQKNRIEDTTVERSPESNQQAMEEYLDLYVNFRLKVKAAEEAGLQRRESFKQELAQYKEQLAKPYLTENRVTEQLIRETYERMKQEVRASHILIEVPENASAQDTLKAYQMADSLRALAQNGASFSMLAEQYSSDPSAASNGGDLGYFSALQMVYPFEKVAYSTSVGNVSNPVRTRFGYHIIKVNDKRPSQGKVKVAHIMIRPDSESDSATYQKARQVHQQLLTGADWNEMVERFSEDVSTKSRGGELPYFGTGNMIESFEDAAFALSAPGDISSPVKTRFGWHIIKLIDRQGLDSLEKMRPSLERQVERNIQAEVRQEEMVSSLKQESDYQANKANIAQAIYYLHAGAQAESAEPDRGGVLFSIADTTLEVGNFYDFVQEKQGALAADSVLAHQLYQDFEATTLLEHEKTHLADNNEEYRRILQEYRNGILLFDIMEQKVWSKAVEDSTGLQQYFENHRETYRWKERAEATILDAQSQDILETAKQELGEINEPLSDEVIAKIESTFNEDTPLALQIHQSKYERGEERSSVEAVIDQVTWEKGAYSRTENDRFYHILIHDVLPPKLKELDEIRGIVIADYQNELDQQWIATLREKYPVEINEDVLQFLGQQTEP